MAICDIPISNLPLDEWVEDDFEITNRAGGIHHAEHLIAKHLQFTNLVQGNLLHRTIFNSDMKVNVKCSNLD